MAPAASLTRAGARLHHRPASAAPSRPARQAGRDAAARPPLGPEPTHAEIEQLVRRQFDEVNRNGGIDTLQEVVRWERGQRAR